MTDLPQPVRPRLILASTSPYRQMLLGKLGYPFECVAPDVDETRGRNEAPAELATRLAREKALAVADRFAEGLVIGCDQVAVLDGDVIGKPVTRERAHAQLQRASGRTLEFLTAVCLTRVRPRHSLLEMDHCRVRFRELRTEMIERYLDRESPLDCAGSFKSEGLGIALLERMETGDPNALVGLPLIRLVGLLARFGVAVP